MFAIVAHMCQRKGPHIYFDCPSTEWCWSTSSNRSCFMIAGMNAATNSRQISLLSMERKSREHRRDEFGVAVFSFRRDNTGGTARRYREVGREGLGRKQPHHADFCERAVSPAPRQVAMRLKCGSRGHRDR